jgi:hypothetical protein
LGLLAPLDTDQSELKLQEELTPYLRDQYVLFQADFAEMLGHKIRCLRKCFGDYAEVIKTPNEPFAPVGEHTND